MVQTELAAGRAWGSGDGSLEAPVGPFAQGNYLTGQGESDVWDPHSLPSLMPGDSLNEEERALPIFLNRGFGDSSL